jgi:hypothetical protein
LVDPHPVGIWDSVGNLLASVIVPSGTGGTLVSGFRFTSIAPFLVGPVAFYDWRLRKWDIPDLFRFLVPSITPIAGLSFGPGTLFTNANSLTRPTTPVPEFGMNGFFGPNFLVGTPTEIPEPGAIRLTLLGLAVVMGILFFRRKASTGTLDCGFRR